MQKIIVQSLIESKINEKCLSYLIDRHVQNDQRNKYQLEIPKFMN